VVKNHAFSTPPVLAPSLMLIY